jgi:glutamate dehydrogenase
MRKSIPRRRLTLIDRIVAAARGRRGAPAPGLLRGYFIGVGEEDLAARTPGEAAALAARHAALAARRSPGETLIEVLPPDAVPPGVRPVSRVLIVTDDRPFLVDSIGLAFARAGIGVHTLIHPVMQVERDRNGRLKSAVGAGAAPGAGKESWQLHEIDPLFDADVRASMLELLRAGLADVAAAVDDWRPMRERMRAAALALGAQGAPSTRGGDARRAEDIALLDWMYGAHFVFQGYERLRLQRGRLRRVPRSGLGILRGMASGTDAGVDAPASARARDGLHITKSRRRSTVHRPGHLDQISVLERDPRGRVVGEHRFLGLWTATAYFAAPAEIPVVRHKVDEVVAAFGLDPTSHDGKAVLAVLETWPRDELFQASVPELVGFVRGAVNLYERRTTRVIMRHDTAGGFWSCMVFVPRDRYTTEVRLRIERLLLGHCGAEDLESQVQIALSNHARLHVTLRGGRAALGTPVDEAALGREIAEAAATWQDGLQAALYAAWPPEEAARLMYRHGARFPAAYQSEVGPADALSDIAALEALAADPAQPQLRLWRPAGAPRARVHLRVARSGGPAPIAELLPVLENFGLRMLAERPWRIAPLGDPAPVAAGMDDVALQDFELELRDAPAGTDPLRAGERFLTALRAVRAGTLDDDAFNRLVLLTALDGHETGVLRACCRWLLQTGIPFSLAYMARTLAAHPGIAADLWRLFALRLAPTAGPRAGRAQAKPASRLIERLHTRLEAVSHADEDRILRAFMGVILATLRTNFFQRDPDGSRRPALALKLDPHAVADLPLPRPYREIYVLGPRVEGVHLRMGEVARGGLRWSDRREDFRTEVLGLMKAQNVKNTLIVPVGAKGGFVPRRLPVGGPREAVQAEGVSAYKTYIGALLDVTDDIRGKRIVPPAGVRRLDGDDPYLVVAADKGTATFSDIANGISVARGFWLGDAFASGGSAGYDHKKMGITARGGWECVKRHFRELGIDTQSQPFTVAGIGDMSGDVFGNGMLLSRQIRLVAAFNHQHVFLDPAPDPARSFAERARLFALPRSGWNDYDKRAISRGGGVFERSAKAIPLSAEARALLGIEASSAPPQEVIRAILRLSVDLLWNGGIGTYVKASTEPQSAAGDRTNDGLRVDGRELRARVVGEGGNLGLTQRGRVEYALAGGRINTDFIDNSAGVNTSDVEVNLKILTNAIESRGRLRRAERDKLFARLTDEVAGLVLRNNYLQSQALSTLELQGHARLPEFQGLIGSLERSGELNRAVEHLPDDDAIAQRRKQGQTLTRPELAVLLSYSKIWLTRQLLGSDLPEDRGFAQELMRYFPSAVRERFTADIRRHRLRREIVATAVTNSLVNRMGPTFVGRACADTGASAADVARAWGIARDSFEARALWQSVEALDTKIPAAAQYAIHGESARLLRHATVWLLRRRPGRLSVAEAVAEYHGPIAHLRRALPRILEGRALEAWQTARARHAAGGAPAAIAAEAASLAALDAALDICELARTHGAGQGAAAIEATARTWFGASAALSIDLLEARIDSLTVDGALQAQARAGLRDGLRASQVRILGQLIGTPVSAGGRADAWAARWQAWSAGRSSRLESWRRTLREVEAAGGADFASLSVCVDALRALAD